jgi:membrane-anchored protein YejM (alkaline phosphatase superfamily)
MILSETPRRKLVTQLVNWGHWFALLNIVVAIIIASVYILNSPSPGTLLGTVYMFSNWFSHISFLTFFGFVILVLPLCYWVNNAKVVKVISSILAAVALALLGFDALLYNKYGVHLSLHAAELIRNEAQTAIAEFGWQQWGFLLLLFVVWLSFQLIVANAIWQRIARLQKRKLGLPITTFFVLCFVTSHAMHIWADAKLYQPIVQQDNVFPLSYPATAKTLMSRYSLLDLENYQQRKALQFDQSILGIRYPLAPIYCAVEQSKKVLLLLQIEGESSVDLASLNPVKQHYSLNSSVAAAQLSTLFGLPELYHPALSGKRPLLLNLPGKLGLSVAVYSKTTITHAGISPFTMDWQNFEQQLQNTELNLAVGFVSQQQIRAVLTPQVLANYQVVISSLAPSDSGHAMLLSNIQLQDGLYSTEDFAPTIVNLMGCNAPVNTYSTGRDMLAPRNRTWLVSTQGSKVIVLHNEQRIEVMANGNARVFGLASGKEISAPVDTNLLSQAIKRLSAFSSK